MIPTVYLFKSDSRIFHSNPVLLLVQMYLLLDLKSCIIHKWHMVSYCVFPHNWSDAKSIVEFCQGDSYSRQPLPTFFIWRVYY